MQKITIRPNGTIRVQTINNEPDMAQQQYKDSTDVNTIMNKYEKTGVVTHLAKSQGYFKELGEPEDLLDAKMRLIKAERAFDALPAEIRAQCDHNPANFLTMLKDPTKKELLTQYGILDPVKKTDPGVVTPDPKKT